MSNPFKKAVAQVEAAVQAINTPTMKQTMLQYKAELYGKIVILVPPKNTTQTCSHCGHIMSGDEKLTLDIREWDCPSCGTRHLRDVNAAINILNRGLKAVSQS